MRSEDYEAISADLKRRRIPVEIKQVISIMLDKKAERVVVLKLRGLSDITDFMIICHGTSTRQNNAICDEIQKKMGKLFKLKPFGVEGQREGEWILIDYIDFVIHVFTEETRNKYSIEKMWMDARRYDFYVD